MILLAQAFWLGRALARGRARSYLEGIADFLRSRHMRVSRQREMGPQEQEAFRRAVLLSEAQARRDVRLGAGELRSAFLNWYFRLF
jgi:hypothetical protein